MFQFYVVGIDGVEDDILFSGLARGGGKACPSRVNPHIICLF